MSSAAPSRPVDARMLAAITAHACATPAASPAWRAALREALYAALAAGLESLADPACRAEVAPLVPGATMLGGARVPGTSLELEPVHAAYCFGAMLRWPRTGEVGAPIGHGADVLGGLAVAADYASRLALAAGGEVVDVATFLARLHQAQAIQRVTSLGYLVPGSDPLLDARVATAAVGAVLSGASGLQVHAATHEAALAETPDRRVPWAMALATSRGLSDALRACRGPGGAAPAAEPALEGYFEADPPAPPDGTALAAFASAVRAHYPPRQAERLLALIEDVPALEAMPWPHFVAHLVRN
jgi:2-methylcitrate dehydratase